MVFISVGTQKQDFSRLLRLVENSNELKDEEIVAQVGYTKYSSNKIKQIKFMDQNEFEEYFNKADYVICHGGVGTIFNGLYKYKKILAVPRLAKYKEHVNDHQIEICKKLQDEGYILYYEDGENFDFKVRELMDKEFKKYETDSKYLEILKKQI